ncbi:DUF3040 domain-containing protein [Actinophytocola sp. NPDC049390]|uniref:DUF3040 domain-containing protein n=1 Tax=Actinophytocola sp. NPDC049390 TaxID=3363894 RepID=UPI0037B25915
MLSHDEDRHLREIERWFEESDPAFTKMLRDHQPPPRRHLRSAARVAVDVTGALLFVVGAAAASAVLMVFGILTLAVGACLHLAGRY